MRVDNAAIAAAYAPMRTEREGLESWTEAARAPVNAPSDLAIMLGRYDPRLYEEVGRFKVSRGAVSLDYTILVSTARALLEKLQYVLERAHLTTRVLHKTFMKQDSGPGKL